MGTLYLYLNDLLMGLRGWCWYTFGYGIIWKAAHWLEAENDCFFNWWFSRRCR